MAFAKWRAEAAAMAAQQYKMHGAVEKMLERNLSRAFEKWRSVAAELKQERKSAAELELAEQQQRREALTAVLQETSS